MQMTQYSIKQRVLRSVGEVALGTIALLFGILALSYLLITTQQVAVPNAQLSVSIDESATVEAIADQMNLLPYDYALFDQSKGELLVGHYQEMEQKYYQAVFESQKENVHGSTAYVPYSNHRFSLVVRQPLIPEFTNPALRFISWNVFSYILFFVGECLMITWSVLRLVKEFSQNFQAVRSISLSMGKPHVSKRLVQSRLLEFEEILGTLEEKSQELAHLLDAERKEKKDLSFQVAALSHDVKTPLTVLKGNLELLGMTSLTNQQVSFVGSMERSIAIFETYFQSMLSYTRLLYEDNSHRERIVLEELVDDVWSETKDMLDRKSIDFHLINEVGSVVFWGNALLLHRALMNILVNAVQYGRDGGRIDLTICRDDSYLLFKTWNDGAPFSADALLQGTNLFFTEDGGRSGEHYGIGLTFAQGVAKLHQGYLQLHNPPTSGAEVLFAIEDKEIGN
ncbi:sensor histidine kinase [Streptococcus cuniculi]|uniref:histidine kinase n=1 Tax=Streptococcus cuniculi TaxID=1432788 RepID=A0A4Y9JAQ6_9STRE|nr:HAMP domain-containing sensor histidine kinase [Streptococcus cuniculi]MBF0779159.1 HAMP domain-containing histidine kinase [Streptococcus cuniculi]TFU96885.1 HAMP domain-containing histidine kinase [Streptococcus cuniculi]